jgi:hypothetical protein
MCLSLAKLLLREAMLALRLRDTLALRLRRSSLLDAMAASLDEPSSGVPDGRSTSAGATTTTVSVLEP